MDVPDILSGSNNTNKLSPQELSVIILPVCFVQIIQINLALKNDVYDMYVKISGSNNTNKLSPQEHLPTGRRLLLSSNNTNKLSPQERPKPCSLKDRCSNNTNKLSPQERLQLCCFNAMVQIIQINLALKNTN